MDLNSRYSLIFNDLGDLDFCGPLENTGRVGNEVKWTISKHFVLANW